MASKASSKCLIGAKSISTNLTRQASTTAAAASTATSTSRARLRWNLTDSDEATLSKFVRKAEERNKRKASERQKMLNESTTSIPPFSQKVRSTTSFPRLTRATPTILQINIGKFCNLNCRHCHVESGPTQTRENMSLRTIQRCLDLLRNSPSIDTVDITGGAPELNPYFRLLVTEARKLGKKVIDRCNLAVLFEKGQEDLAEFLSEQGVDVVASLPCYTPDNTDKQRGKRVFDDSITAIQTLNAAGFGHPSATNRRLDLVYNPVGASLPPPQSTLESDYRTRLWTDHGITFNALFTITNMPIKRFADDLYATGQYASYMEVLANAFNPGTVEGLMCRNTVNVAWDGKIYDCDFNAALEMEVLVKGGEGDGRGPRKADVWAFDDLSSLEGGVIRTDKHCYGCTAGSGSSCGGALA